MDWWNMRAAEVEKALKTDGRKGLSSQEAAKRLAEQGRNRLEQGDGKKGFFGKFLAQFQDFMILLLIGAAVVSFGVSYWNGERDFVDSAIIIAIVVLNAFLGVIQESKAEKALEALKELSAPKAKVLRDGAEREISAEEVVVGDILLLAAGDYICADGRILENHGMKAEESAITGESLAVEKETGILPAQTLLGDRKNMVLSGSYVLAGKGMAVVTATGMHTEIGHIASLLAEQEDNETPLQKKLAETGKTLGIGALLICGVIFVMGLLRKQEPFHMFMTSVSLAVAAIPEGLPAIVTIVLAIGMQRMSKKNTIIRRLPAVETLGGAEIICSDKTGTLTQNRMKVVQMAAIGRSLEQNEEKRRFILTLFTLCNDARRKGTRILGEPTEKALAEAAEEGGVSLNSFKSSMLIAFLLLFFLSVMVLINMFLSRKVSEPMRRLEEAVNQIEAGDLDTKIEPSGFYEVWHLGRAIDDMQNHLKQLMRDIVAEHESKRRSELMVLQNQINPHFLYNTLDIIVWMIENEKREEAVNVVTALARFFRISLSKGKNIITVGDEIEHVRNYLMIQEMRFKNRFTYSFHVEEGVERYGTIKLILQPIVENAIYHAMEFMDGDGEITITVRRDGRDLLFLVADNGCGMTEDIVSSILAGENVGKGKGGVGLQNVQERLHLVFGTEYGMTLSSEPDEGTEVTIRIPAIGWEELEKRGLDRIENENEDIYTP